MQLLTKYSHLALSLLNSSGLQLAFDFKKLFVLLPFWVLSVSFVEFSLFLLLLELFVAVVFCSVENLAFLELDTFRSAVFEDEA